MIPGRQYTPYEVLRAIVWDRKWVILVSFVGATIATNVVASRLPNRYRAETLILAASQSVAPDFVRASVTTETVRDRLPTISQQIISRSRLERIIQDLNLYADERRKKPIEVVVERMRNDIEVQTVEGSDSFRVSYESESPRLAMEATERLAGLFIEENLQDRKVLAEETSEFLQSQLEDARNRLVEQEKRLEAYRLRYGGELPTQLQSNIQVIQNTQAQIQALGEAMNRDRDRRLLVARQLADLQSEEFLTPPPVAGLGTPAPEATASAQLEAARADLRAQELRLTAEHPDLLRAKQLVADLERRAQQEAAVASGGRTKPLTQSEIAKRNRIKELEAEIESLDRQVADKVAEEAQLHTTLQTYQARVEAVPTRESDLISITRDYDTLQNIYRTLLAKKEDSKIAENLERRQVGDQFKILDPPHRPERPFRPNRQLIDLCGAAGGLVFGIAMASAFALRDKRVKDEADIRAALDVPVLAMVPTMISSTERHTMRLRKVRISVALVIVLFACATAVWLTLHR